jgi:thiol:disulfide interchange protein DsbD
MCLNKTISILFYFFVNVFTTLSFAQEIEHPTDKVNFTANIEQKNCEVFIVFDIKIINNWYINAANLPKESFSIPTQIMLDSSSNYIAFDSIIEPIFLEIYDSLAKEKLYLHDGEIVVKKKIKVISNKAFNLSGEFIFQTCDNNHCLPIYSEKFTLPVEGCLNEKENLNAIENNSNQNTIKYWLIGGFLVLIVMIFLIKKKK